MAGKQIAQATCILVASWYGMMFVHESGHCLAAWMSGAVVDRVDIPLLGFSKTEVSSADHPLLVVWGGPVLGVVAPLSILPFARKHFRDAILFFVGFCAVANGAYIGFGATLRVGDCQELRLHGAAVWQLWLFGLTSLLLGFYLWHRLGPLKRWFLPSKD